MNDLPDHARPALGLRSGSLGLQGMDGGGFLLHVSPERCRPGLQLNVLRHVLQLHVQLLLLLYMMMLH